METLSIQFKDVPLKGKVLIPGSKSISNRLLLLEYLSGGDFELENISSSDDTRKMQLLLSKIEETDEDQDLVYLDCGNAGTVVRFLTAALAFKEGEWILDGSERMRHRPISPLVDALRSIGVGINYEGEEGFPPIRIIGRSGNMEQGGISIDIDASVSSQFVSALMMVSCLFPHGVHIRMKGDEKVSLPYTQMTAQLMRNCGVQVEFIDGSNIFVNGAPQEPMQKFVESDWTSASYFYGLLALSPKGGELLLNHLREDSWQGDHILYEWFEKWGIESKFTEDGLRLLRKGNDLLLKPEKIEIDFTHHPDLMPTMAVVCAASGVEAFFTGIHTLRFKETDRILAITNELEAMGIVTEVDAKDNLHIYPSKPIILNTTFKTYGDHRMAMAFSMLSVIGEVRIENPGVVIKSFDTYWESLRKIGSKQHS